MILLRTQLQSMPALTRLHVKSARNVDQWLGQLCPYGQALVELRLVTDLATFKHIGVPTLRAHQYPQKYPQHRFAGKLKQSVRRKWTSSINDL